MENQKTKYRYIQFPLCLIRETYKDAKKGFNLILCYGIVKYASKIEYKMNRVTEQLIYDFVRNPGILHDYTLKRLKAAGKDLSIDSSASDASNPGFNIDGEYEPSNEAKTSILNLLESDNRLMAEAILNYQYHKAAKDLKIKVYNNEALTRGYKEASEIQKGFESRFGKDAMPFCKPDLVLDFRDKDQNQIDLFRGFIGIYSMIGFRQFISSNKPAVLSRMIGCKSKEAFEYYKDDKTLSPTVKKYSGRYQMDKLILALAERGFIMYLSKEKVSTIYFSKYMNPEELRDLVKHNKAQQNIKKKIKEVSAEL